MTPGTFYFPHGLFICLLYMLYAPEIVLHYKNDYQIFCMTATIH